MAIDLLSVPPMSAKPERIFLGARRTISWQRMSLGHVNIERTECLKSWIRGGIVSGWRRELLVNVLEKEAESRWRFRRTPRTIATSTPCQDWWYGLYKPLSRYYRDDEYLKALNDMNTIIGMNIHSFIIGSPASTFAVSWASLFIKRTND